jgi:hypothetical protein
MDISRRSMLKNLTALSAVAAGSTSQQSHAAGTQENTFRYTIGIVGNPTIPDVRWSNEQLDLIKKAGFNTLQLSIAWASKPAGEVLNLEDLDDRRNVLEWHRRTAKAKEMGFRTLAQFGLPVGPATDATTCILDPSVRARYAARLQQFFREFHAVDDVMVYTYDQHAWLCSEFGNCPRCRGIPLSQRLPGFLEEMVAAVQDSKPGVRFWWEPWEVSAGQTYAIAEVIRPDHFGLIVHNAIAEVQFVNTTDHWVRNLARIAQRRGIPVIGEGFFTGSGEDIWPLTHLACPRLVYQQLDALRKTQGVVGVKEYYGILPQSRCPNLEIFTAYLAAPDVPFQELLNPIAGVYGPSSHESILDAWEITAEAMEIFPWDASWTIRRIFGTEVNKVWRAVPLASWITPSWQANRRAFYMVTDERRASSRASEDVGLASPWKTELQNSLYEHPWLLEDTGLRALAAGRRFDDAASLLSVSIRQASAGTSSLHAQWRDVVQAAAVSKHFGQQLLNAIHYT